MGNPKFIVLAQEEESISALRVNTLLPMTSETTRVQSNLAMHSWTFEVLLKLKN